MPPPRLEWLEDRPLLSSSLEFGPSLLAGAVPLTLGTGGTAAGHVDLSVAAGPPAIYRLEPTNPGVLSVRASPATGPIRLALLDDQGREIVEGDGQAAGAPADLTEHLEPGTYYLAAVAPDPGAAGLAVHAAFRPANAPGGLASIDPSPAGIPKIVAAVGDLNGDGNDDVVTTDAGLGVVTVRLAKADGSLNQADRIAVGGTPSAVALADLDGDGKLDLVVADASSGRVVVFLGKGDGTFGGPKPFAAGSGPIGLAVGDLNGDGKPDLVVVDAGAPGSTPGSPDGPGLSILINAGSGSFGPAARVLAGADPRAAAIGDLDGDPYSDIAVADAASKAILVLGGTGGGTFAPPRTFKAGGAPQALAIADINRDGRADIVAADTGTNALAVLYARGGGFFDAPALVPVGSGPDAVAVADLDGDGKPDLIAADAGSGDVATVISKGDGTFRTATKTAVGADPTSVAVASAGGARKLIAADAGSGDVAIVGFTVINGNASFARTGTVQVGVDPNALVAADVNGDGIPDLLTPDYGSDSVSLFTGLGDGTFAPAVNLPLPTGAGPAALAVADVNGDGRPDIVVADSGADSVSVLLNQGGGRFVPTAPVPAGKRPEAVAVADVNGDGVPDILVADYGSDEVTVLFGLGDGAFRPPFSTTAGSGPTNLVVADVNGDGKPDLVVLDAGKTSSSYPGGPGGYGGYLGGYGGFFAATPADAGSPGVVVLLGRGDGTFEAPKQVGAGRSTLAITVADVNGDGKPDLIALQGIRNAYLGTATAQASIYAGRGDGTFAKPQILPVPPNADALAVADVNGDGRPDLITADGQSGDVAVQLGRGGGAFQEPTHFPVQNQPSAIAVADLNGDGQPDLVTVSRSGDASVLLGDGRGSFRPRPGIPVGDKPASLAVSDLNGDGHADLVAADSGSNDVSVLLGNGDGTFGAASRVPVGSDPIAVVARDLNRDGRPDLVVADAGSKDVSVLLGLGDRTFEQAAPPSALGGVPTALAVDDLNGDGFPDIVVAESSTGDPGRVEVLFGRGDGTFGRPMPLPAGSYPTAVAVADVNGDGRPDIVVADGGTPYSYGPLGRPGYYGYGAYGDYDYGPYYGTSGGRPGISVLLNRGEGTFGAPTQAEIGGTPTSVAVGDVNGDGKPDVVATLSGTDYLAVAPGNGDGTFGKSSRFSAGDSPQAVVIGSLDGDGRPDLVALDQGHFSTQTNSFVGGGVSVLQGTGGGVFLAARSFAVGGSPVALAIGPLTGDRLPDLITAEAATGDVNVLFNTGDGSFAPPSAPPAPFQAAPMLDDLNGDGIPDAVVLDRAGEILVRRGRPGPQGGFDPPVVINPGSPARSFAIVATAGGYEIAAADADDDAVSLYGWSPHASGTARAGGFRRLARLATHSQPTQVVAGALDGPRRQGLAILEARPGTVEVFLDGFGGFYPAAPLEVGPGATDLALADFSGAGLPDLLVSGGDSGTLAILPNLGGGRFGPARAFAAGPGPYESAPSPGAPASSSEVGTTRAVVGHFSVGGPAGVVAIDAGDGALEYLAGLPSGGLADPVRLPLPVPAEAAVAADFGGHKSDDLAVLGPDGIRILRGDGRGGFLPPSDPIAAGPDPTGLSVADVNVDGKPDLVVSNGFGDLLVLYNDGSGGFRTSRGADSRVTLALPGQAGGKGQDFVLIVDQARDTFAVVKADGAGQTTAPPGLIGPGAVLLSDLNGDGIPDLIIANSGANNVLVFPGLGGGLFGPSVNGGTGFYTGTNPSGLTVADLNGDGIPDLVVANRGSNDVSVLFGKGRGAGWTLVPGPRLKAGSGPTSVAVHDVNGDGIPDLVVSDSQSNQARVLLGLGGGFFNDAQPKILPVGADPGPIFVLPVEGQPAVVTVNAGSNDVSVVTDVLGAAPVVRSVGTGGVDPIAASAFSAGGETGLAVANNGSDSIGVLVAGNSGLGFLQALPGGAGLPNPSGVEAVPLGGGELAVYATSDGSDSFSLLSVSLSGQATNPGGGGTPPEAGGGGTGSEPGGGPSPGPVIVGILPGTSGGSVGPTPLPQSTSQHVTELSPLEDQSLALVATVVTVYSSPSASADAPPEEAAPAAATPAALGLPTQGITRSGEAPTPGGEGPDASPDGRDEDPAHPGFPPPLIPGLDAALERARDALLDRDGARGTGDAPRFPVDGPAQLDWVDWLMDAPGGTRPAGAGSTSEDAPPEDRSSGVGPGPGERGHSYSISYVSQLAVPCMVAPVTFRSRSDGDSKRRTPT
jgi:hypothetical protein